MSEPTVKSEKKPVKAAKPVKTEKSGPITVTSKTASTGGKLKVTLTKGWAGKREDQLRILRGLGLRRREQSNILVVWHEPTSHTDADIEAIRSTYKQRFSQDSVMRVDSVSCVSF